jgi:pSer/pThr/pTyr-binding forkhead associated (FHA) protein
MSDSRTQMLSDPHRTQMGTAPSLDPNRTVMGAAPSLNATITIKPVQCPVCKTFNPVGVMFCVDCGLIFDRALPDDAFGAPAIQVPILLEEGGREHPLRPGTTIIGREADLNLADGRVSRRHAQIVSEDGALTLTDLGSTNGTRVDGETVSAPRTLQGGEKISFGGLELQLVMPGGPKGQATQVFATNKTAAVAPPRKESAPAVLEGSGLRFDLRAGKNSFGRKAENDVVIADPYVSGRHGLIEIDPDGLFLTDIGSTNGTLLNEAKLAPNMRTRITEEDTIRLGSLELRVHRAEAT